MHSIEENGAPQAEYPAAFETREGFRAVENSKEELHRPPGRPLFLRAPPAVPLSYNAYNSYGLERGGMMRITRLPLSTVRRLLVESGKRLKRMANRHGWTPSDASARLVEEGLRRSEFAYIDFRDSAAGRQAYVQGSTLAVWEVSLLVQSYQADLPQSPNTSSGRKGKSKRRPITRKRFQKRSRRHCPRMLPRILRH